MYKNISYLSFINLWWLTDFTLSCYYTDQKSLQLTVKKNLNLK